MFLLPIKSILIPCKKFLVQGVWNSNHLPLSNLLKIIIFDNNNAVNNVVKIPMIKVIAKP